MKERHKSFGVPWISPVGEYTEHTELWVEI